ncbi:PGPGW domain-containing protein [Sphingomonas sp. AP4-R1]|uniref:PGPGW domain-containing protein n=1 Tax=Sphingomonas sp. AP4-R1 TaxID=2735134 RepID=UPI0020A3591F|nr:PGPGW domain-containing protein [Sphingomonas sp. AP4-R1]
MAQPPYRWSMKAKSEHMRLCLLALGWFLVVLSPVVGVLPGPGGIFLFAPGLVLLLRNSAWVRKRYAMLKRRWPKAGHMCDQAMRRQSALRRQRIAKARALGTD